MCVLVGELPSSSQLEEKIYVCGILLEVCIFYLIEVRRTEYDIDWVRVVDIF